MPQTLSQPTHSMRELFLFLLISFFSLPTLGAAAPYTLVDAFNEWHDLSLLQKPADPPRRFGQLSSWDRNEGNFDQGNFLRTDGFEEVLMDVKGPGVLTRLWTAEPMGLLRFYWDGAEEPQFAIEWQELQAQTMSPLVEPFVSSRGGGCTMRFPLPFREGLKITLSEKTWPHWQIHYQYFPPDTEVESWWPALGPPPGAREAYTRAAVAFEDPVMKAEVPGNIIWEKDVTLNAKQPITGMTSTEPVIVTEIGLVQDRQTPLPENLLIEIVQGEEVIRLPWRSLAGVWDTLRDSPSLLQGRGGPSTYFRVPFFLTPQDSISFLLNGEGSFAGHFVVKATPQEEQNEMAPRLMIAASKQGVGGGKRYDSDWLTGSGRLLAVTTRVNAIGNAYYMEGDELIYLEGSQEPTIRGTGMEDLFDSAWYFSTGEFTTAWAAAPLVSNSYLDVAARTTWWPFGIPFAKSLRFALQGGALDDAPPTTHDLVLIGQRFGPVRSVTSPEEEEVTLDSNLFGRRVTSGTDEAGFPIYQEFIPPLAAHSRPFEFWLEPGNEISGTFDVDLPTSEVPYLSVRLDLPYGWKGQLAGPGQEKEVYDIGWPPLEYWTPEKGTFSFTWKANPPEGLRFGHYLVQLRAEAQLPDGSFYTVAHPVKIYATPAREPFIEWSAAEIDEITAQEYRVELPADFTASPGDLVVLDLEAGHPENLTLGEGRLLYMPLGPVPNVVSQFEEIAGLLPQNGEAFGRMLFTGERHQVVFPVGRFQNWAGNPRELLFSFAHYPEATVEVFGARLLRHGRYPGTQGWSIRRPYKELAPGGFAPPEGLRSLLSDVELGRKIKRTVATPQDRIVPELRSTFYLENVEAAPLDWRLAEPVRREGPARPASQGYLFPARYLGERVQITDESIRGARRLALQFGYGPWCGTVGVRDCEGRLVGVKELYMNKPSTFPQYLEIHLPVPSRDPWLYLEALAPSPAGQEYRIPIQKVMVLDPLPEQMTSN